MSLRNGKTKAHRPLYRLSSEHTNWICCNDPKNRRDRGSSIRSLVIIQNQTRGAEATLGSLLGTGSRNLDCDYAFSGTSPKGPNPYDSVLKYRWDSIEPVDWLLELRERLGPKIYDLFLELDNPSGISQTDADVRLWTSGLIQRIFRQRALDRIHSEGLTELYAWFFFVRSDYFFSNPIPAPSRLDPNGILVMEGESYGGLNDRLLGFNAGKMPQILELSRLDMLSKPPAQTAFVNFMAEHSVKNPESLLLFQVKAAGLYGSIQRLSQLGFCVRKADEGTRGSAGVWCSKRKVFVKYLNELILSKTARFFRRELMHNGRPSAVKLSRLRDKESLHLRAVIFLTSKGYLWPLLLVIGEPRLSFAIWSKNRNKT